MEIQELKTGIETTKEQILTSEQGIENMSKALEEQNNLLAKKCESVAEILKEIDNEKAKIAEKNKIIKGKQNIKEQLLSEISEFELEIKKKSHNVKKFEEEFKKAKARVYIELYIQNEIYYIKQNLLQEKEHTKNTENIDPSYAKKVEELSEEEGCHLETRLKTLQEKIKALSRTVNPVAQNLLEIEEKRVSCTIK